MPPENDATDATVEVVAPVANAKPWFATLVRGLHYDCKGYVFSNEKGTLTQKIDQATKDYLEANAVEEFSAKGETFQKPRFKFSKTDPNAVPEDDEAEAAPKKRRR